MKSVGWQAVAFYNIFLCGILCNLLGQGWNGVIPGLAVPLSPVRWLVSMRGHYSMYYRCGEEMCGEEMHGEAKRGSISSNTAEDKSAKCLILLNWKTKASYFYFCRNMNKFNVCQDFSVI